MKDIKLDSKNKIYMQAYAKPTFIAWPTSI